MKLTRVATLCAGFLALTASAASATPISFHVQVNTAPLVGNSSAPFALDFQLNGGNPLGNTATITHFTFGGGSATSNPAATTFGLAAGNLASTVTLTDNAANAFNEFFQGFIPGSLLTFDVLLTTNVNTPTPDAFSFAILDRNLLNIPTTGLGDALLLVNVTSPNLGLANVLTFGGSGAFSGVTVTAIPEPASLFLVGVGLAGVKRWRLRSAGNRT